jgi:hypothetical protein
MERAHPPEVAADSISIARYRELLGRDADGLSDDEVDLIRQHADAMAHVIVEIFIAKITTRD